MKSGGNFLEELPLFFLELESSRRVRGGGSASPPDALISLAFIDVSIPAVSDVSPKEVTAEDPAMLDARDIATGRWLKEYPYSQVIKP